MARKKTPRRPSKPKRPSKGKGAETEPKGAPRFENRRSKGIVGRSRVPRDQPGQPTGDPRVLPGFIPPPLPGLLPPPSIIVPRDVIGRDDRKVIIPAVASTYPYCTICSIVGLPVDRRRGISHGTGTLIGRRTIVTARHVVDAPELGGILDLATAYPGRAYIPEGHQQIFPFGGETVRSDRIRVHPELDVAAIFLTEEPSDARGRRLDAALAYSDMPAESLGGPVHNLGYPMQVPPEFSGRYPPFEAMFWNAAVVTGITDALISYNLDTLPGQSGSAIFKYFPDQPLRTRYLMVAVHVQGGGDGQNNFGVRINSGMFDQFDAWRRENDDTD